MSNSSNPPRNRSSGRGRVRNKEATADAHARLAKQALDAENAAFDARTAKLRALRLAKEESKRLEAVTNLGPLTPSAEKCVSIKSQR